MSDRYRRQKLLPWLSDAGQARLRRSSVLIARVGGLGGPLAQSLALAGVGRIVLYHDGELLEEDLQRMVLMDPSAIGKPRAPQAAARLRAYGVEVQAYDARITQADADRWLRSVDLAIGAAPTFDERLVLNDAAVRARKPYIDAAMYADETQLFTVNPGVTACLRCVLPEPPAWRDDFPVLAAVSAVVGNLAASVAVRILCGEGRVLWGDYVHVDVENFALTKVRVPRRPDCRACGGLS